MAAMGVSVSRFIFLMLLAAASASAQLARCPYQYIYHFGDGVTDIGNSVRILPWGPSLPAAKPPYGRTTPGYPTGRWSDGLIDFDFAAFDTGYPAVTAYLSGNTTNNDVIIFSVARSPVLGREFFEERGVRIPPFAVPVNGQARWFRQYLKEVSPTPEARADRLRDSIIFFGDIEANDIGYALSQGKSIEEVRTYVPFIIDTQLTIARDMILQGARTFVIPGSAPIGCYPYILEALQTGNPDDYDEYGCLKSVNDLIDWKNDRLNQSVQELQAEFPDTLLVYSPFAVGFRAYLQEYAAPNGTVTLAACCGGGGRYNFNAERFCGSAGARVCDDPSEFLFWDGYYFTEDAYNRIEKIMVQASFDVFNCTVLNRAAAGIIRPAVAVA